MPESLQGPKSSRGLLEHRGMPPSHSEHTWTQPTPTLGSTLELLALAPEADGADSLSRVNTVCLPNNRLRTG